MTEVRVYPDLSTLARAAATHFVTLARANTAQGRWFTVALSGGTTPRDVYALLATDEFAPCVDWSYVHIFWGDERCVPPEHPQSNYRMAREALLDHVPIPEDHVHRIPGEMEPTEAALAYERTLRRFFAQHPEETGSIKNGAIARFDLILLGLGEDGHTASLFPGTAALHQHTRWVVAQYVQVLGAWRITLTPPVINAAANATFIIAGANKAERLHQVLHGPYQPDRLPAQIVRPTAGRLLWLVDAEAAALL
jgi:6-phosphogluconolactonase